ncbi:hypothetical protein B0O79_1616 [Flavobacteriaceae bacterium MAR_2009_75]|nr:hypothetical protein B0O79_1616 [Flavobacteriaceae bacterium MAR_2009_75]
MSLKKRYLTVLPCILFLFYGQVTLGQNKYEREYRIKKSQFPKAALDYISDKIEDTRRVRFYKETDSTKISYEAKFKKDRLRYSVEFDEDGTLEDIEILIKEVDIPNDSYAQITKYLDAQFSKYRIRRMQQQYPVGEDDIETTIRNAFQNLMLPNINYEFIVSGKKKNGYEQFEILFDSQGNFVNLRKSLPPNYDHVLY